MWWYLLNNVQKWQWKIIKGIIESVICLLSLFPNPLLSPAEEEQSDANANANAAQQHICSVGLFTLRNHGDY